MKQWQDFSARQSDELVSANFLCDTDDIGLILVNGEDALEFLQGQLSNDIALIDESLFQLSSYSTPKGRLLGVFRIVQISNGYILVTTRAMVLPLMQRLYHYIVQSKVTLADASDHFARFAMQTNQVKTLKHPLLAKSPGECFQNDSVISLQFEPLDGQQRHLLLCLSGDDAIALWNEFSQDLQIAGFNSWRLSEIRSGIPIIYPETIEAFVLQMANLNHLEAVSFKKGCYPGQEIVARMQYLGTLKRRMFLAQLETDQLPGPGDDLVTAGKSVVDGSGKVVDAEFDQNGLCLCLYIAQIAKAEAGSLQLLAQPETPIRNIDLPYSLQN
jgi:folate-binding protein YgfZ